MLGREVTTFRVWDVFFDKTVQRTKSQEPVIFGSAMLG